MGKGRQIAAMFKEHFRKNRGAGCASIRGLWISVLPRPLPCCPLVSVKPSLGCCLPCCPFLPCMYLYLVVTVYAYCAFCPVYRSDAERARAHVS